MPTLLTEKQRKVELASLFLTGWSLLDSRDAITKEYKFRSFIYAFGWMSSIAIVAEKMNHHPEWSNVYSNVNVILTTHSENGLTELDLDLARKMDALKS